MSAAALEPPGRRYSIAHLALIVPWVALVLGAWKTIDDNSFLWHVRAGTVQSDRLEVLTADPFSFTMHGEPWRTQSWLAELFYGWAEGLSGLGFVAPTILALSSLTFVGLGAIAYRRTRNVPATALLLIVSTLMLVSFLSPRPVLFSYLLMTLVIVAWEQESSRWTVPLLFWVWAAVHASFAVGLVYLALVVVSRKEWRYAPHVVAAGLATILTAHGLGVVDFLIDFGASRDALQYLTEWRRPGLTEPVFWVFAGSVAAAVMGVVRRRVPVGDLWILVPFTLLGLTSIRAMPQAYLAIFPVVASAFVGLKVPLRVQIARPVAMVAGGIIMVLPFFLVQRPALSEERFPLDAAEHLADLPTFHDDVVGGYLIWEGGPDRLVYVDDRAELYGARLGELVAIRTGEMDWRPVFERDGIEQALLAVGEPLVELLEDGGWSVTHSDRYFVVLTPGP